MMGMGDVDVNMISANPIRQKSLLAALNLLRELEANDSLTDDMKTILADLDSKLSAMELTYETNTSEPVEFLKDRELNDAKEKLKSAHEKIMVWESNNDMVWESGPETASEFIGAVEDVVCLVELFKSLCMKGDDKHKGVITQAVDVLEVAMQRLEEELVHVLSHRRQSYFPSEVEDGAPEEANRATKEPENVVFDLIDPEAIPFLKSIRKTMFDAKYDSEFCTAYVKIQKEALEDCLIGLGMETVSIDELVKMAWDIMASKIKTWTQVVRTAVQVYFLAEKRLCDEVFGESEPSASRSLISITKSSMTCLFNFGHAMALGPHAPEKLFYILDMYEVLAEVQDQINILFSEQGDLSVKTEFEEVLGRLGDSARATFLGFGDVILSDRTVDPFPGGGVHPLSSYVMNYIIVYLPDYCKTLNTLLQEKDQDDNKVAKNQVGPEKSLLAVHLRSIAANLKSNLEKKSQLYRDVALQHVFLMNNTHYIQQKVMNSELQKIFGDEWIRTQIVNYQQHATSYVRTTWSSVVASLRDDGIPSGSGSGVKVVLKEKIRVFSVAFEDVYRNQTGWSIRDEQLKEELRISISQKVILAYQSFIGRHSKYDIEKYVKYDSDDLENLLRDFFEGSQKSLNYRRR